eukprot:357022-Chlamydomonas_euryale.AAC.8
MRPHPNASVDLADVAPRRNIPSGVCGPTPALPPLVCAAPHLHSPPWCVRPTPALPPWCVRPHTCTPPSVCAAPHLHSSSGVPAPGLHPPLRGVCGHPRMSHLVDAANDARLSHAARHAVEALVDEAREVAAASAANSMPRAPQRFRPAEYNFPRRTLLSRVS